VSRQANTSQSPDHGHSPRAARSAYRTALGTEIASGARWKRFLLAVSALSGLEAVSPGGTFVRRRRGSHG